MLSLNLAFHTLDFSTEFHDCKNAHLSVDEHSDHLEFSYRDLSAYGEMKECHTICGKHAAFLKETNVYTNCNFYSFIIHKINVSFSLLDKHVTVTLQKSQFLSLSSGLLCLLC